MSTRNEPYHNESSDYDSGSDSDRTDDAGQEVVVTGKPVKVTTAHRVLRFFSPSLDGVVIRTADGQLVEEPIASPSVALPGHVILSLFFLCVVLAYFIYSLVVFFNRPETTVYLQAESRGLIYQPIRVTARCTNPPHCGTMTIQANYTQVQQDGCGGATSVNKTSAPVFNSTTGSYETQEDTLVVDLCYVSDLVYSTNEQGVPPVPGIQVDFSSVNPGFDNTTTSGKQVADLNKKAIGVVTVESVHSSGSKGNTLNRVVSMDAHQVKTLVIGRTITKQGDMEEVVDDSMIPGAVQYEGKRINSFGATVFVRYDSYAIVEKTKRQGTLIEVIANVGGCASIVGTILMMLAPLVALFLPGSQ